MYKKFKKSLIHFKIYKKIKTFFKNHFLNIQKNKNSFCQFVSHFIF
jgi:hypothetical protein